MKNLARGAVLLMMVAGMPAHAQTVDSPGSADNALEEITVTARKRAESLINVPIAINVFTASEIASAGIERPQDFVEMTPNMTLVQTQNQGTSFVVVRGISQARNSEPSVAVLIDGVQLANPSQFNQELYDIEHIEVLKGPQGALYGRDAIGGAIIIDTKQPSDKLEGNVMLGYDSGPGYKVRGDLSGPIGGTDTLKFRTSFSIFNTKGYIENDYLHEKADPFRDISVRANLLWQPNTDFTADLRFSMSHLITQAVYYSVTADVNTIAPIQVNNPGIDRRDLYDTSLKLDYDTSFGQLTSISAYDSVEEFFDGDQFNDLPIKQSILYLLYGHDQAQATYLKSESYSQELRFTSPTEKSLRWIVGAYGIYTDHFLSTGNVYDYGTGIPEVTYTPLPLYNPQTSFLADQQDNFAWAAFADLSYDVTDSLEGTLALRYDDDNRKNITKTPTQFIPAELAGSAYPGQVRQRSWDALQPKVTLRYKVNPDIVAYADYGRGFRSGGFNQTGVGAAGIAGIKDYFDKEIADTAEVGVKTQFFDRRVGADVAVYHTVDRGAYFFVYDPITGTQNLGNLGRVIYKGLELETSARVVEGFDVHADVGFTNSNIRESDRSPTDVGHQTSLVSKYTIDTGGQYRYSLAAWKEGLSAVLRADYERIGPTYWFPDNISVRNPIDLVNMRIGVEGPVWSVTAWSKNLFDKIYNAEWAPGPNFPGPPGTNSGVFRAEPRVWGVDFKYHF